MLFWSSPSPGNHRCFKKIILHGGVVSVLTHAIFSTFFPHFKIHLPHCLVHLWVTKKPIPIIPIFFSIKQWALCKKPKQKQIWNGCMIHIFEECVSSSVNITFVSMFCVCFKGAVLYLNMAEMEYHAVNHDFIRVKSPENKTLCVWCILTTIQWASGPLPQSWPCWTAMNFARPAQTN